jgi:hypothetical protein
MMNSGLNSTVFQTKKIMLKKTHIIIIIFSLFVVLCSGGRAFSWFDETHIAIAREAGYFKWYHAAGPDIAKIKAGRIETYNHWFNNPENLEITSDIVLSQAKKYNDPGDKDGHLYGAIIAAVREYRETTKRGRYAEYHLAYCAHYIGDLTQPLHNVPYDTFNRTRHDANDGIVNREILSNSKRIQDHVYTIHLSKKNFERDLAEEIARTANISRRLGQKLKREKRNMTEKEAYRQLGHSVSLFKAVLRYFGKIKE